MIISVLALALLPATLLASPTLHKIQDIIGFETGTEDTLAKAKISIYNLLPLDAYTYLRHWRGDDESTKQEFEWDWVPPDDKTTDEEFQFNTMRKDWDRWEAGIRFRDPNWSLWTEKFYLPPGVKDIKRSLGFRLITDVIDGHFSGRWFPPPAEGRFTLKGPEWPKEAIGINSFFFLQVQNNLDTQASVDVELETRSNTWKQDQTFIQMKGETSEQPLPFFFERNATKEYAEMFSIKVSRNAGRSLFAKPKQCEMDVDDAGSMKTLKVNSTGWSIGTDIKVTCDGKWQTRKSGMNGDDEVEL